MTAIAIDERVLVRKRLVALEYLLGPYVDVCVTLLNGLPDTVIWRVPSSSPRHLWNECVVTGADVAKAEMLITSEQPTSMEGWRLRIADLEAAAQPFVDVTACHLRWGNRDNVAMLRPRWGSKGRVRVSWAHAREAVAILTPSPAIMAATAQE